MSETNFDPSKLTNQSVLQDNLQEVIHASPNHPFTRVVRKIQEKGKDIYTNTIHYGLLAGVIGKSLLTLGAKFGAIELETHNTILSVFEPLQHVTNIGASYAIIGVSVATAEFARGALEATNQPNAAKIVNKSLPALGAISAVGIQLFVESRHIVPWDTLDPKDALYGIAIIVPGYFAARHFLSKNFHLREKGIALFGKLGKKVSSPSEIILPQNDLTVIEVKEE